MATTTKIHVTATDNELYILASTPAGSDEIVHIKSGYNNLVEYVVIPQSILAKGAYTLIMVGINWGGPQAFKVILTTGGVDTPYAAPAGSAVGATWTVAVPITV
jgi:chemotaxis response regulator CheB